MFPLRIVRLLFLMLVLVSSQVLADDQLSASTAPAEEPVITQPLSGGLLSPDMLTEKSSLPSLHLSAPVKEPRKSGMDPEYNTAIKVAKQAGLIYLTDSATNEFTRSALRGISAGRLADAFNILGNGKLVGLLGLGYVIGGPHAKSTYGTAIEAAGDAMLITESLKFLTGRMRPCQSGGDPYEFEGPGSGFASFPSGHTSNAFAIATVFAHKNPKKKWLYYALAAGVGYARMQKQAHFGSDVFAGAVVGTYAGKKAVDGKSLFGKLAH
ncbi:MAG: phosphatase PAP2 family protein [Armatimonadota bacterium]